MDDQCCEVFKQKTTENYKAFVSLYEDNLFNAASNRIYYCLIHAALTKGFISGASESCFIRNDLTTKFKNKIDKSKIEDNIWGLGIKQKKEFKLLLIHAKNARIKADYMSMLVIKEDLEENIKEKLKTILETEGVM